ncbi:MAG: rod shape-determining protein MreC, partial [Arsenophonus sp. ET-DL12-MAG3]
MKLIFSQKSYLQLHIIIMIIISIILIIFDSKFNAFNKIRSYLDTVVIPFYFLVNSPQKILDNISYMLIKKKQLIFENK